MNVQKTARLEPLSQENIAHTVVFETLPEEGSGGQKVVCEHAALLALFLQHMPPNAFIMLTFSGKLTRQRNT